MGKQSSRLYFQGKDHKDIYFQGNYHDAMYVGSDLVWEKLDGKIEPILYEDVSVGVPEEYRKTHVKNMVSTVFGSVVFCAASRAGYARNGSAYLFYYSPSDEFAYISGKNTALQGSGNVLFPDMGLYQTKAVVDRLNTVNEVPIYAFSSLLGTVMDVAGPTRPGQVSDFYYTARMLDMESGEITRNIPFTVNGASLPTYKNTGECRFWIGESQYFGGRIYANMSITYSSFSPGWYSTTDGVNWKSIEPGRKVTGNETVIGNYLFYENGKAVNLEFDEISYAKKPAICVNGWYYAEELEEGYLMRSQDLLAWERYKRLGIRRDFTVSGYWRTKNLLCLKKSVSDEYGEAGIYKYEIQLL